MNHFEKDLNTLLAKLKNSGDENTERGLQNLKNRLLSLRKEGLVKINHSVMELVCAKHLLLRGYDVDVEHSLTNGLTCDVHGVKGYGTHIVEIETGFVPPQHALDPATYCKTRIASKISRYSNYANKFGLGLPPYYVMQIPPTLTKPPRYRTSEELEEIKNYCDQYYKNPPVTLEEIRNARLHVVYIIDMNGAVVKEIDPDTFIENIDGKR